MRRILYFLLLILFFASCSSETEIVEEHNWKYIEGYHIGDWKSNLRVKNDTLYSGKNPIAIFKSLDFKIDHYNLTIKSLKNNDEGLYTSK